MDRLATEVVVEVGTEGASYGLYRERTADGFAYFVTLSDMPYPDDDGATGVVRNSPRVASFEEALLLFDQEPFWPILSAVRVHPEYAARVLAAVEARLPGVEPRGRRKDALRQWRETCWRAER
ncbi:MAG: hypothetical protein JWP01_2535 [Myxococcales bacterium]|nr:hypothetical protein [Myxococcales bacterium]